MIFIKVLFFLNIFIFLISCGNTQPVSGGHDLPNLVKVKLNFNGTAKDESTLVVLYKKNGYSFTKISDTTVLSVSNLEFNIEKDSSEYVVLAYNADSSNGAISYLENDSASLLLQPTSNVTVTHLTSTEPVYMLPYPGSIINKDSVVTFNKVPSCNYHLLQFSDTGEIFSTISFVPPESIVEIDVSSLKDTLMYWDFNLYNTPKYQMNNVNLIYEDSVKCAQFYDSSCVISQDGINLRDLHEIGLQFKIDSLNVGDTAKLIGVQSEAGINNFKLNISLISSDSILFKLINFNQFLVCKFKIDNLNQINNLILDLNDTGLIVELNSVKIKTDFIVSLSRAQYPYLGDRKQNKSLNMFVYKFYMF